MTSTLTLIVLLSAAVALCCASDDAAASCRGDACTVNRMIVFSPKAPTVAADALEFTFSEIPQPAADELVINVEYAALHLAGACVPTRCRITSIDRLD